jgi:hypothetical protein
MEIDILLDVCVVKFVKIFKVYVFWQEKCEQSNNFEDSGQMETMLTD